ncbi:MAG: substrate-binding domain-containing protein [Candidatus Latescibacteria bacterium]|nr:substrate-binding domain-containing protein [Candidatus Latescibacterota bacterium]MBT4136525.1 substrate-binding domain-containing protein [Candidatus Latescibacterota bacterium]MBT5829001.1 substrate-binding domain-containing protein [Candidatus Latescibacterota bacterium]
MRKKISLLLFCIPILLFSISTPTNAQPKYKFAFVTHGGPGNPFWNVVIKGMEDAGKRYQVDVQWLSNPTFSISDMPNFLDDAIANQVNGIGITCPDPDAIRESIERAHELNIPIIVLNTADPDAGTTQALPTEFYIGASEYLGGQSNAKSLMAEAKKRGITIQRAVCPIQELGHSGLEARYAGFESILKPEGIPVDGLTISNNIEQSAGLLKDYFLGHPQTNAIATLGPLPADAFYLFVEEEGKTPGEILHATHDTSPAIFDHIRTGHTVQAVDQQPYLQGYLTVAFLYLHNEFGLTLAQDVLTGPFAINAQNVDRIVELMKAGYR